MSSIAGRRSGGVPDAAPRSAVHAVAAPLVIVVLVAVLVLLTAAASSAATKSRQAPSAEPTVPVMVVLDASGSMNQEDAPGPRIDAAKAAVNSLIDSLPRQAQVGLQVYGTGTGSTDAERTAGCTDIKTLVPVGPLDANALKSQVNSVVAAGYTPIGNALRAAADALPNEGPRSIVLVSDGEDTCAPPTPCDVAGELHQQGLELIIHTVGFKVDAAAREQLSCIAQATGGTYSDAADAGQLTQALAIKVDYATAGYTTVGAPVTGADQPSAEAPLLTPVSTLTASRSVDRARRWTRPGRPSTTQSRYSPVTVPTFRRRSSRRMPPRRPSPNRWAWMPT